MKSKINLTYNFHIGYLRIYWNGILFLCIFMEDFTGMQSWENNGLYVIQIYSNGPEIKVEFDSEDKWIAVLRTLNEAIEQK